MPSLDPLTVERQMYFDMLGIPDDSSMSLAEVRGLTGGGVNAARAAEAGSSLSSDAARLNIQYVDPNQPNENGNGTSWASAKLTIQDALDAINTEVPGHQYGTIYLAPTIHVIDAPIELTSGQNLIGVSIGGGAGGGSATTIKPSADFVGDMLIRSKSWRLGDWWHWGTIQNVTVNAEGRVPYGIALHSMGEESVVRRVSIFNAASAALMLTGDHAVAQIENISVWTSPIGVRLQQHPGPSAPDATNGGVVRFIGLSGDGNTAAHLSIGGSQSVTVIGIKSEGHNADVVHFDGASSGGAAPTLFITGKMNRGSGAVGNLFHIQGTVRPQILASGLFHTGYLNAVYDEVAVKTLSIVNTFIIGTTVPLFLYGNHNSVSANAIDLMSDTAIRGSVGVGGATRFNMLVANSGNQVVLSAGHASAGVQLRAAGNGTYGTTVRVNANDTGVGFYGATPVARAAAIASPAADVAELKTAVDAIRVALSAIGITS